MSDQKVQVMIDKLFIKIKVEPKTIPNFDCTKCGRTLGSTLMPGLMLSSRMNSFDYTISTMCVACLLPHKLTGTATLNVNPDNLAESTVDLGIEHAQLVAFETGDTP